MAGVNFVDTGVEAIFSELLKAVLDEIKKANFFKPFFEQLELTLRRIGPVIVEIEDLDRRLDRSDDEIAMFTRQLQECLDLVCQCAKVRREDYLGKGLYAKKLGEFESSLLRWAANREGGDEDNEFVGRCEAPGGPDFLMGLDEPIGELKAKLLDGGGEHVVVLSGPEGCGKTTLAKKLCSDEGIKGIFKDNIFFVTVSKSPNLMVIVMELFQHMGYPVPEFQTVEDAINQLERMLKQLKADHILLVLDGVCLESEFLIETLEFNIPGYKILVTSRSKIGRFFNYELELLDDLDAMALFLHHSALLQDGYSRIPDNLVKRIVKGCGGLPSALIEVGKSLRVKPVSVWNDRLTQCSEGQSIVRSNNQLPLCPQISTDALNELEKEYFMDFAAFPRDQRIAVATFIDMWAGLDNLNEYSEPAFSNLREFLELNYLEVYQTIWGHKEEKFLELKSFHSCRFLSCKITN